MVEERLRLAAGEDLLVYEGWQTSEEVIRIILTSFSPTADSVRPGVGLGAAAVCSESKRVAYRQPAILACDYRILFPYLGMQMQAPGSQRECSDFWGEGSPLKLVTVFRVSVKSLERC